MKKSERVKYYAIKVCCFDDIVMIDEVCVVIIEFKFFFYILVFGVGVEYVGIQR